MRATWPTGECARRRFDFFRERKFRALALFGGKKRETKLVSLSRARARLVEEEWGAFYRGVDATRNTACGAAPRLFLKGGKRFH
jgi:hypothetical protein